MEPNQIIFLYMIKKQINSDALFVSGGADINVVYEMADKMIAGSYITREEIDMFGFKIGKYSLTGNGEEELQKTYTSLTERWQEILALLKDEKSDQLVNLVVENEQQIQMMVIMEIITEAEAREVFDLVNKIRGNKTAEQPTDTGNEIIREGLQNYLGSFVQY